MLPQPLHLTCGHVFSSTAFAPLLVWVTVRVRDLRWETGTRDKWKAPNEYLLDERKDKRRLTPAKGVCALHRGSDMSTAVIMQRGGQTDTAAHSEGLRGGGMMAPAGEGPSAKAA